jgi:hypothetical protein
LARGDWVLAPPSIAPPLVLGLPVIFAGGELPSLSPRLGSSPLPEIGQRAIAHLVHVQHSHGLAERPPFGWGFSQGLQCGNPTFAPCPAFQVFSANPLPNGSKSPRFTSGGISGSGVFLATPPPLGLPLSLLGGVRLPLRREVCAEQSMASPPVPGAQGGYSGFFVGSVPFFPVPAAPLRKMENGL